MAMSQAEKYAPLVSVIIPNYNHARFLDERIQSVLNQTYQNFEVIILDDKSTDNSVEVINKYKDNPHISCVVVNEKNSGSTFIQWHKGFELAKGELIWIAESDDSCDDTFLSTLIHGYVDNNAILAFCRSCRYDVNGNKSVYTHQSILPWDIVMSGREFISQYLSNRNAVANASSAIFSRNIAMSIDRKYQTMKSLGDWMFWIELIEHGNVVFYTAELNYFRFHNTNTTKLLELQGITAIEHKTIFDYLVNNEYIKKQDVKNEKRKILYYKMNAKYESHFSRRKVMKVWDKWLVGRFYIFFSSLKDTLLLIIRNLL